MNWKKWLGYNLYKKLWSIWPGRPLTFWLRDTWHRFEGIWIICLIACGAVACHYFGLRYVLIGLGIFVIGYIGGHLFWGTPYIPNQRGK